MSFTARRRFDAIHYTLMGFYELTIFVVLLGPYLALRIVGVHRDELRDWGNVSVLVPGEEAMWITPSAMFKGSLDPEIILGCYAVEG